MATDIRNIKRLKWMRRIGLVGLFISVFVIIIILILSFLPKGNSAFTIKVDNASEAAHFQMELVDEDTETGEKTSKSISHISAAPLAKARPTEAAVVESKLEELRKDGKLMRSNNIKEIDGNNEETGYELALIYSLNLKNTSLEEKQVIKYQVNVDRVGDDSSIIEYLRILIYTYEVDSDQKANYKYFANSRRIETMAQYPYKDNPEESREAVSSRSFEYIEDPSTLPEGSQIRAYYSAPKTAIGEQDYCTPFDPYQSGHLLSDRSVTVDPNKTLNFTIVVYFEGKDLDCENQKPDNANLLLSLHFGA